MSEMEVSTEWNGPSEDHPEVPSPPAVESKDVNATAEKVSPEGMCRQLSTAFKEMDVIDSIVANSKRSDLQQDYVQMTETLLQKRHNCKNLNTVDRCNVNNVVNNNTGKNVNLVNASNSNKVNGNVKTNTKRNARQISSNANDSGEFRTPNKKLIAKATFTSNKAQVSDALVTNNHYQALSADAEAEEESVTVVRKMPPIMVKPKEQLPSIRMIVGTGDTANVENGSIWRICSNLRKKGPKLSLRLNDYLKA
ncbi:hypothetical protein CEXT_48241 [Caerostris extrusa]|uniref:Uncharacterized protein n=1 Tax=Caerostris extrusa TaxID=172846 RepID=A0AAV4XM53_CAEEX|nr:hypothetical protein CEXT_48241 [Caerostris extrusa]